jgi:hypothetical protein
MGLAGLEPAPSSLSEIDGRALCYPAFPLVVLLRKSYKDGVNLSVQVQPSVLAHPICAGPLHGVVICEWCLDEASELAAGAAVEDPAKGSMRLEAPGLEGRCRSCCKEARQG